MSEQLRRVVVTVEAPGGLVPCVEIEYHDDVAVATWIDGIRRPLRELLDEAVLDQTVTG